MVKINLLTYLTFNLNMLVDKGKGMPIKRDQAVMRKKNNTSRVARAISFCRNTPRLIITKVAARCRRRN